MAFIATLNISGNISLNCGPVIASFDGIEGVSDSWMAYEGMVMILLDDLFLQLRVGWNVKECFPVDQIVFFVPGRVLKF